MSDELRSLLNGRCSPELVDALSDLDDVMASAGFDMHQDEIDYLIGNESFEDPGSIVSSVDRILRIGADKALGSGFGVGISETISIPMLQSAVSALADFDVGDHYEELSAILEMDMAADETLADVLGVLSPYSAEDWLPQLISVEDSLIQTMTNAVAQYEATPVELNQVDPQVVERVNWFHTQEEEAFSKQALDEGVPMGLSMEQLYQHYNERLASIPVQQAMKDLVSLGMMSNLSMESLGDEAAFFLEDLYPTLEDNQQANRLLRKELERVNALKGVGNA